MEEGDGMHAGRVPHPVLAMSEAEQEQAMQLAQMAQQRAMHPPPEHASESLGQVHEHQHSPGLVDAAEISNLKYCRNCGEMKPRKEFHRNHSKADELEDVCKPCKAARDAARRRNRAAVIPSVEFKTCKKCAEEKRAGEFPRNKLTSDGLHSYCKRCKLAMDSASREKRKRMDNHAVRRSGPAPGEGAAQAGQAGLPSGAPLQDLQHYCDACKQLCVAQEHAEGPEMPNTMRCTACGSVALPIDPAVIQALNGAIASHGSQQDYDSHDPAALQGGVVQPPATATYHLQLNSSEPPPVATMQIQISEAPPAEAVQGHPSSLSSLLSDPSHVQQAVRPGEGKTCGACQVEKALTHFPPSAACRDGLAPHCRDCIEGSASGHPGYHSGGGQPGAAGLKRPGRRPRAPAEYPITEKVCRKCKANKPAADFPQKKSHPDGRDDYCKACHAKATAARVAARGPVKEPTVGSKVCSKCQEQKAASEFHRDCNKPDGLRGRCRTCEAAAGQARRMARVKPEAPAAAHPDKPDGEFPQIMEAMSGLEDMSKGRNSTAPAEDQDPANGHHEGDVDMGATYQEQNASPEAQHLSPGHRPSLPYAAGLPAPLPLAFPPVSAVAAEGTQWSAIQGSEEAANAHRMALQTQQLMAQLQGMIPPGMQQVEGVRESFAQPSLHHEGEQDSMPMGDQGSREDSAVQAELSSGSSGQAAQHGDKGDSQQMPQHEASELDNSRYPRQEHHQAVEQEDWQQDDRPDYQQLPDLADRQEAAGVS